MSIKVLVFESDNAFAGELRNELGNLGCAVRVVDDGNIGLQQAQAERPDLILLSIELPRMNGFSVCNKLKKDQELKDVPLIIMSSESSEETFEQHKKLRTRAEAYVHKPIPFVDLLREIDSFVSLAPALPRGAGEHPGGNSRPDGDTLAGADDPTNLDDSSGIMIDEEDPVEAVPLERVPDSGRTAMFQVPSISRNRGRVDPDIDAFADDAFGRLQSGGDIQTGAYAVSNPASVAGTREEAPVSRSTRPPPASAGRQIGADGSAGRELEQARTELGALTSELELAKSRGDELARALEEAREEVARVKLDAEADAAQIKQDLEELRTRPPPVVAPVRAGSVPPKGGGVSSREFLDLRETLSKKDKEILALKQQLTGKDKEVFEVRERSLAHEGRVSELDDRVLAKDRELAEAGDRLDDVNGQLEATRKELTDLGTELERVEKDLADQRARRDQESVSHEAATAALRADAALETRRLKEERESALAKALAGFKNELDAAEAAFAAAREDAARDHAAALAEEFAKGEARQAAAAAARDEASRQHAEALGALRSELEKQAADGQAAREEASRRHEDTVAGLRSELDKQAAAAVVARDAAVRELAEANARAASELDKQKAAALAERADLVRQHEAARAAAAEEADTLKVAALAAREAELKAETDTKLASLHRGHQEELQRARTDAEGRETVLKDELSRATERGVDLDRQLGVASSARTSLETQLGASVSKAAALEDELGALRGELDETRKNLTRESSRATRALAKWEADRASLERAKDALAVALSQLDEAEARQISE